jgi:hypothetical protein
VHSASSRVARYALGICGAAALATLGCTKAMFQTIDDSGHGGAAAGAGGRGGAGGATAGTGGGGSGGAGTGGSLAGTGGGGAGGSVAGTGGGGGTGGVAGSGGGGRGGATAGTGGGGTGGAVAGSGGTGGSSGTGGTGGTGGVGGRGGSGGTTGSGGSSGTGGNLDGGPDGPQGIMPTVAGQIVITELLHDVNGVENNGEWFEVYNPSTTVTYDLMGCLIHDISPTPTVVINTPLVLPPGAFRTLAISSSPGFTPDFVYGITIKFDNDAADQVAIVCNGVDIDAFGYSTADATDASATGHSFSVDPDHYTSVDNDVRANWCLGTTMYMIAGSVDYGTPGGPNPQCP